MLHEGLLNSLRSLPRWELFSRPLDLTAFAAVGSCDKQLPSMRPFARSSSCPPEMHATTRAKGHQLSTFPLPPPIQGQTDLEL
eukprot:2634203-Amphidinium_carterae.1